MWIVNLMERKTVLGVHGTQTLWAFSDSHDCLLFSKGIACVPNSTIIITNLLAPYKDFCAGD